jgi:hypothetical protein
MAIESLVRKKYFLTSEQSVMFKFLTCYLDFNWQKNVKLLGVNYVRLTQNLKSDKKMLPEISIPRLYFMILEKIRFNTHEQTCI